MRNLPTYYLSSLDSRSLQEPRTCSFRRLVHFDTRKKAIIASIEPPIQTQTQNGWTVVDTIVLTNRHEGYELDAITAFPCFVYVALLLEGDIEVVQIITKSQLSVIGVAELYCTESDAKNYVFDQS